MSNREHPKINITEEEAPESIKNIPSLESIGRTLKRMETMKWIKLKGERKAGSKSEWTAGKKFLVSNDLREMTKKRC